MRLLHLHFWMSVVVVCLAACGGGDGSDGPGSPSSLTKVAGDNQSAPAGTPAQDSLSVLVRDAGEDPVPDIVVSFAVTGGGGVVAEGAATSNAAGVATIWGWTLGGQGAQALTASTSGAPSVIFAATALDPCVFATSYSIGTTVDGQLSSTDCLLGDGSYADMYRATVSTPNAFLFQQSSSSFDSFLLLLASDATPIALNDDAGGGLNSAFKVLLPAGAYFPVATSYDPGVVGGYSLSSMVVSASITGCEEVFARRGIATSQVLQSSDCALGAFYADFLVIYLVAGQNVTLSMSSSTFDTYLELYDPNGLVAVNDDQDATTTNSRIFYTPSSSGFYGVAPSSYLSATTGSYVLTIQ